MIKNILNKFVGFILPIRIKGNDNILEINSKKDNSFKIRVFGNSNCLKIGKNCILSNTIISIYGNNNNLIIGDNVRFIGPCKIVMGGNSTLKIGYNCGIRGVDFELKDANIIVGKLCMFSFGITLRNHDSHRIISSQTKQVLNPAKDIYLGNHVWVGQNATILKGANIGDDSIIGFGAIVTCNCNPGSILVGVPAKVVKQNVTWDY